MLGKLGSFIHCFVEKLVKTLLRCLFLDCVGSNPGGMITNFKDNGDHYILNGAKMWISNAPFADIAVVWAKDENNRIKGLIVERGMEGFETPEMVVHLQD